MDKENSVTPFRYELTEHPEFTSQTNRLQYFRDRPEFVVKELTYKSLHDNQGLREEDEAELPYMTRQAGYGQKLLREFSESAGIRTPSTQMLVGANEYGDEVLYRVSEQVLGSDLETAIREGEIPENAVEHLVASLFEYYKDKFESQEDYAIDLAWAGQYRYGRTASNAEKAIYLVDTDPYYGRGSNSKATTGEDEDDFTIEDMIANVPSFLAEIANIRGSDTAPKLEAEITAFMESQGISKHYEFN